MQVGLIGKGYWGKILLSKLKNISNVKFICGSKDDYKTKLDSVDWIFIATPNDTHYEIVKYCIKKGKNIFCEKPLTPTYDQSKELFKLAEKYNVKLYVNDVFNYRDEKNPPQDIEFDQELNLFFSPSLQKYYNKDSVMKFIQE